MDKKMFKKKYGKCAICEERQYEILDVHRIAEGQEYEEGNCLVLCCRCHRMHHAGLLKIINKFYSTGGWILIYEQDAKEVTKHI